MTDFLVRHFVSDYQETGKASVRGGYSILASTIGIICNVLLFAGKLLIGVIMNSVAVMADAFNNLSDAGSSVIGLVGMRMAVKPADKEHPFGHGRIEYIATLIVSFVILQVGFSFFKESVEKIRQPEVLHFSVVSLLILVASILVKVWLAMLNRKLGRRIDSKVMQATAADATGDILVTAATVIAILVSHFTGVNIDGYIGVLVSLAVMWAGISIAKDTVEPLIGEAAAPEEYRRIAGFVESYDGIVGSHDLIIHNYGVGRNMASIHAEVPNDVDIEVSHEVIDRVERDAQKYLGIFLVIHMDPIETKDKNVLRVRRQITAAVKAADPAVTMHDFRMVEGKDQINLIFDLVVPYEYDDEEARRLEEEVKERLRREDPRYEFVITVDRSYVRTKE